MAGCDVVRAEKVTGSTWSGRTELQLLLDFLRRGDTLVVTLIDRLVRSIKDFQDIVYTLKQRGVTLKATEQAIDTRSAAGKACPGHAASTLTETDPQSAHGIDPVSSYFLIQTGI